MRATNQLVLTLLVVVGTITDCATAAKVIFLLPIASQYDKIVFDPLIKALALRDYDVTVVSPIPSRGLPTSVKEIHPATLEELGIGLTSHGKGLLETRQELQDSFFPISWNSSTVEYGCHRLYNDVEIKYLLRGLKRFDLAIVNGIQNECALGLVHFFRVPHIYLTTHAAPNFVVGRFGHYFPASFVSSPFTGFDDKMTFMERTVNYIVETALVFYTQYYLYPRYEDIYRQYLGQETPDIAEIEDNVGVVLMNTNYLMSYARPLLPNLIEVGGLHCRPPRPLPTELDKFLSEAEDGFIYFSLGSLVMAKDLPEDIQYLFLNVFAELDQRVIWKWDAENLTLPDNVRLYPWLPQQDILGHGNIRLFISNGGLLSTQEAIYHNIPLLGIPLTGEHDLNMKQAEHAGFAATWEILSRNQTRLEELIDRMLIEPNYKARAKHFSKMYRELPDVALEKALYWVDYVIKNKGAPHLRSSAKDLNFVEYHCLDVIAFLISVLALTVYLLYYVISTLCCHQSESGAKERRNGSFPNDKSKKYN